MCTYLGNKNEERLIVSSLASSSTLFCLKEMKWKSKKKGFCMWTSGVHRVNGGRRALHPSHKKQSVIII
jgi:hypothetical protein